MRAIIGGGLLALVSMIWVSGLGLAAGVAPTEFVRQTTDNILQMFEDPHRQGSAQRQERLARLRQIAETAFDWPEIAQRVLGPHWRERTPQEHQEFTEIFREAVQGMYLERLETAAHQRLKDKPMIRYDAEQIDDQRSVVRTTVVTKRLREIPVEYRLRQSGGQWRVYDIVIMGVSLVSNYRAQCQRIIAQSSYHGLVELLKARQLGAVFVEPSPTPR